MGDAALALGFPLSELAVRPVGDGAERSEWDRVMDEGRCLGFRGMFGGGLRHVAAGPDGEWLALLGWCAGAFKVGVRDRWIGWALSLSARRLSADMEARFGRPVLLAETFVDPERFRGSCCLGAGWTPLGRTRGYARARSGWTEHGRPKEVLVRPLSPNARAKLAGARGPTAIAEFGRRLGQRRLAAARAFRSPSTGRLSAPSRATMHRLLPAVDPDALDEAVRDFTAARQAPAGRWRSTAGPRR